MNTVTGRTHAKATAAEIKKEKKVPIKHLHG